METINNRFKQLRLACEKSQEEFGKILGLTKSGVSDIERGRRSVTNQHLIMLSNWHEYNVNIEWLRTGEGGSDNKFLHPEENDLVAQARAILGKKDPLFETLVLTYSKMTAKNKEIFMDFFKEFSNILSENDKILESSNKSAESAIKEAEAEYIKSRSTSAKKKDLSASNITEDTEISKRNEVV